MRRILGVFAAAIFLARATQGGIGESEEQIRKDYGEPITVLPKRAGEIGLTKCYLSHGFSIAVTYLEGRSVRETLIKNDNSKISETEIRKLLKKDTGARESARMEGPKMVTAGVQEWRSADQHSRVALYDSATRALFITTQKFISLTSAKSQRNAKIERSDKKLRDRVNAERGASKALTQDVRGAINRSAGFGGGRGQLQPSATPAK